MLDATEFKNTDGGNVPANVIHKEKYRAEFEAGCVPQIPVNVFRRHRTRQCIQGNLYVI